jgi:hypothetical protein
MPCCVILYLAEGTARLTLSCSLRPIAGSAHVLLLQWQYINRADQRSLSIIVSSEQSHLWAISDRKQNRQISPVN